MQYWFLLTILARRWEKTPRSHLAILIPNICPRHKGTSPVVLPASIESIPITHLGTRKMAPGWIRRTGTHCELDLARRDHTDASVSWESTQILCLTVLDKCVFSLPPGNGHPSKQPSVPLGRTEEIIATVYWLWHYRALCRGDLISPSLRVPGLNTGSGVSKAEQGIMPF